MSQPQPAEPKHKSGPRMSGEGLDGKQDAARAAFKFLPMNSAPKDGKAVFLFDDKGTGHECHWRTTRAFKKSTWQETGFWAPLLGPPARLAFEPKGWWREKKNAA